MTNKNKNVGSQWERDCVALFNRLGYPRTERRYGAGAQMDKGDLNVAPGVVVECKNLSKITLSTIADETKREKENAKADIGVALIKRRGKSSEHGYALLSIPDLIFLMKKSGY